MGGSEATGETFGWSGPKNSLPRPGHLPYQQSTINEEGGATCSLPVAEACGLVASDALVVTTGADALSPDGWIADLCPADDDSVRMPAQMPTATAPTAARANRPHSLDLTEPNLG